MFQSLRFKILLGFAYIADTDKLFNKGMYESPYIHLGVQILTIPEISSAIFKQDSLREKYWKTFKDSTLMHKESDKSDRNRFFYSISDFKYLMKEDTMKYLFQKGLAEDFIDYYTALSLRDAIAHPDTHILYPNEGYYMDGIDYQYSINRLAVLVFKEIDYSDLRFNQNIAKSFVENIIFLGKKYDNLEKEGFIEDPVLKLFSIWISNFILTNLAIIEEETPDHQFDSLNQ